MLWLFLMLGQNGCTECKWWLFCYLCPFLYNFIRGYHCPYQSCFPGSVTGSDLSFYELKGLFWLVVYKELVLSQLRLLYMHLPKWWRYGGKRVLRYNFCYRPDLLRFYNSMPIRHLILKYGRIVNLEWELCFQYFPEICRPWYLPCSPILLRRTVPK